MIIHRVRIQRFGCLRHFETELQPGLNVIKGRNEAGKSTLHQAILLALLERPVRKKAHEIYRSWGADDWFDLELEFSAGDNQRWVLVKYFETGDQRLVGQEGEPKSQRDTIEPIIEQALGTLSLAVFSSTVCIAQDAMADISTGRKEISRSLEEIVTGGDDNIYTQDAIKRLEDKVKTYTRGYQTHAPVNPGPLAQLRDQIGKYEKTADQLKQALGDQEEAQERLLELRVRLKEIEEKLPPLSALQTAAEKARNLQAVLERFRREEAELDRVVEQAQRAATAISEAQNELAGLSAIAGLTDDEEQRVAQLHGLIQELKVENSPPILPPPTAETPVSTKRATPVVPLIAASGLVVLGLGSALAGLFALVTQHLAWGLVGLGVGALLFLVGIVWLALLLRHRVQKSASGQPADAPVFPSQTNRLAAAEQELQERLARYGCATWPELNEKRKQAQAAMQRRGEAAARLEVLLPPGQTIQDVERARQEASRQRRDAAEQLQEPQIQRAAGLDRLQYGELVKATDELKSAQSRLKDESLRLTGKTEGVAASREELLRTEEQLEAAKAGLERALERLEVYQLALTCLTEARDNTLQRAQSQLAPRLGQYLSHLTLGRYNEVSVDSELAITIKSPDLSNGFIQPRQLSKGTQDQLYFAARLALVDLLFPEAQPPLFLDDPFVKFDPERRSAAVTLCQQIAEQRQILLFTCSNAYDNAGYLITFRRTVHGDEV